MLVACKNITSNILHNKIKDLFGLIFCNFFSSSPVSSVVVIILL